MLFFTRVFQNFREVMLWCLQRCRGWIHGFSFLFSLNLRLSMTKDFIHNGKPSAFLLFRVLLYLDPFILSFQESYLRPALAGGLIEALSGELRAQLGKHSLISLRRSKLLLNPLVWPLGEQHFDFIWCPNSAQHVCWKQYNLVNPVTALMRCTKTWGLKQHTTGTLMFWGFS